MKTKTIEVNYFEKNDHVRTGNGVGIVLKNEKEQKNIYDLYHQDIIVQHKFGYSKNSSNLPVKIDRSYPILITKEEYDNE